MALLLCVPVAAQPIADAPEGEPVIRLLSDETQEIDENSTLELPSVFEYDFSISQGEELERGERDALGEMLTFEDFQGIGGFDGSTPAPGTEREGPVLDLSLPADGWQETDPNRFDYMTDRRFAQPRPDSTQVGGLVGQSRGFIDRTVDTYNNNGGLPVGNTGLVVTDRCGQADVCIGKRIEW